MRIRHIEVTDFLGYARESLSLPVQGVIAICGVSGTGKSSLIVDAVGFALFGYRATRGERIEELRRQGAPGKAMRVLVAFQREDGSSLEIERGLDAQGRAYAAYRDSHGVEITGPKQVEAELRMAIGSMTWQVYYRAFVARQRELAVMTEAGGSERRQFIHRMLGIDAFDRVSQELRRRARAGDGIVKYIEEEIAGGGEDPAADHRDGVARLAEADARLAELDASAQELTAVAQSAEAQLVPLREVRAQAAEQAKLLAAAEAREPEIAAALAALDREDADARLREELRAQAEEIEQELSAARAEKARHDSALAAADERRRLEAELAERRTEREAIDLSPPDAYDGPDLERVIERLAEIEAEGKQQRAERGRLVENQRLLTEDGTCATCLRPTDGPERARLQEIFQAEIATIDSDLELRRTQYAELAGLREDAAAYMTACDLLRKATEHAGVLDGQIARLQQRRDELDAAVGEPADTSALAVRLERAEGRQADLAAAVAWLKDHADRDERRADLLGRLQRLHEARAVAEAFLQAHPGADDLDGAEAELRQAMADAAAADLARARAQGERDALAVDVQRLAERAQALAEQRQRLGAKRAEVTRTRDLDALTVSFRGALAAELRPQLEEMCSQVMSLLSQGKHPALRIDEDYEIALSRGDGEWLPIRMISGGEDTRANFALRLALTRLITDRTGAPFEYLILDEIFESQDDGHRERMLDVLRGVQSLYPQVFLISHVGELHQSAAVDYVIDVADGDGPDRVSLRAL